MVNDILEKNYLEYFYNYPIQNGFLVFTLGFLFSLTVYHFLFYFQQKDKLYLLYSGYTFFILLSQLHHLEEGFLYRLSLPFGRLTAYPMVYTEIYYVLYVIFALRFLNLKEQLPNWNNIIIKVLVAIAVYCLILLVIHFFDGGFGLLFVGYFIFTILLTLLGIVVYIPFFKVKSVLKYYIIFGSLFLFMFSVASLLVYLNLETQGVSQEPSYSLLYVGFILENILFSLGLGHKQKIILNERNESQEKLINQYKENEKLREKVQLQLKKEMKTMSLEAEAERLKTLQIQYDKDLAELKLLALRSQMNPHFIFNSLNSIKRYMIENDKEKAVYYMNKFAKLIRRILASTMQKEFSLADELETMELYVNIENLRFNQKIDFDIKCDTQIDTNQTKIPSLLLQPFIENAIWHGLSPKKEDMSLQISLSRLSDSEIQIEILDNGIGLLHSKQIKERKIHKNKSVGISLSKERLRHFSLKYQVNGNIQLNDLQHLNSDFIGTQVIIILPYKLN